MFHCATLSHDGAAIHKKNNRSAQYAFDCCRGNMCNENATFAELPPVPVFGMLQKKMDNFKLGFVLQLLNL